VVSFCNFRSLLLLSFPGTLVKREETSKLANTSSFHIFMLHINCVKCLEFVTWEYVCPARGDVMIVRG